MRTTIANVWTSIKRNPVINAFLGAVVLQVLQDWRAGNIDFAHIFGYLATVCLAVVARTFTVPYNEHVETVENFEIAKREAYMKGISTSRATPGIPFEKGDDIG